MRWYLERISYVDGIDLAEAENFMQEDLSFSRMYYLALLVRK